MTNERILGRFNFLSTKTDSFDLVFVPYNGNIIVKIVVDLTRDDMNELRKDLNYALDETNRILNEFHGIEVEDSEKEKQN